MKKRMLGIATALTVLALAGMPGSVSADPGTSTHVDSVAASVSGSVISVTGAATFVNAPVTVAEDSSGDALTPGIGADVTTTSISRAVGSNVLVFKMDIADMPATPAGIMYGWGLSVDGNDTGLYLGASGAGVVCTGGCFRLYRDDGSGNSATVATLSGTIGNGTVTWNVSMSQIGASAGSVISAGQGGLLGTINGAVGAGFCCFVLDDFGPEDYKVPGPSVQLGIAAAGTPEASVPLTSSASVSGSAFSGAVSKPIQSGSYIVVAKACYLPTVCGTKSTTITI